MLPTNTAAADAVVAPRAVQSDSVLAARYASRVLRTTVDPMTIMEATRGDIDRVSVTSGSALGYVTGRTIHLDRRWLRTGYRRGGRVTREGAVVLMHELLHGVRATARGGSDPWARMTKLDRAAEEAMVEVTARVLAPRWLTSRYRRRPQVVSMGGDAYPWCTAAAAGAVSRATGSAAWSRAWRSRVVWLASQPTVTVTGVLVTAAPAGEWRLCQAEVG